MTRKDDPEQLCDVVQVVQSYLGFMRQRFSKCIVI